MKWQFEKERFILCEGEHDQVILDCLIRGRNLPDFQIRKAGESNPEHKGGRGGFGSSIYGFPAIPGFNDLKGIAIITDNDTDRTLDKTVGDLKKYGYQPSKEPDKGSLSGKPVIIILIPDKTTTGKLEDLCLPALYKNWTGGEECVEQFLHCTGANNWEKKKELPKARIRALIAGYCEEDPFKGFHHVFQKEKSLIGHECFDDLANILNSFDDIIK